MSEIDNIEQIDQVDDFIATKRNKDGEPEIIDNDDDLNTKLNARNKEAEKWMAPKIKEWKDNERWVQGKSRDIIPAHQSKTDVPLIWANYRTQVGLLADQNPKIIAMTIPDLSNIENEEEKNVILNKAKKSAALIEANMDYLWEYKVKMAKKMKKIYWSLCKNQVGYLMPYWDYFKDEIGTEYIPERFVKLSPGASDVDSAEYVIIELSKTKKWFRTKYPDKWKNILYFTHASTNWWEEEDKNEKDEVGGRGSLGILEMYLEDDIYIYRAKSKTGGYIILEKGANQLFEFFPELQETEEDDFPENNPNVFDMPKKPLVMFNLPEDDQPFPKTVTDKVKTIQQDIIDQKRQINNNTRGSNGILLVDADTFTQEEVKKIDITKQNLVIRVKGLRDNPNAAQWVFPQAISQVIAGNLDNSMRLMDRIMGLLSEARGEFNPTNKTRGGILALQSASQVPIRELSRAVEQGVSELGMWWLQMMKLFYTRPHYVRRSGIKPGENEFDKITDEDILANTSVMVKAGSMMPRPEELQQEVSIDLAAKRLLAPESMFEKLKYSDPKKEAIRLINWIKNGIVSDEQQMGEPGQEEDAELVLADKENEMLLSGKQINVNEADDDKKHLMVHLQLTQRPEIQERPEIARVLRQHIEEHQQRLASQSGQEGEQFNQENINQQPAVEVG